MWVRWFAFACALLFSVANTAQAAHIHRLSPESAGHHLRAPEAGTPTANTEEHCPLCVAIHPALPAPLHVGPAPVVAQKALPSDAAERRAISAWHFARFSRPPPACE
jgi:hypothetical protein